LLARDHQDCRPDTTPAPVRALLALQRGIALPSMRAGFSDLDFLRYQEPLPETAKRTLRRCARFSAGDKLAQCRVCVDSINSLRILSAIF